MYRYLMIAFISFSSLSSMAGVVDRIFEQYKNSPSLIGKDSVNKNSKCRVDFYTYSDGETMTLVYSGVDKFGRPDNHRQIPGSYKKDYSRPFLKDYIYSRKSHKYGPGDLLGDLIGGYGGSDFSYEVQFYFDDYSKITNVIYLDLLRSKKISHCVIIVQ